MNGIDHAIAQLAGGQTLLIAFAVALLLGLRHATDPDHLAAVSTLIAAEPGDSRRRAARLGLAWGLGHAATLTLFGLPLVVFGAALPDGVRRAAELLAGMMIAALVLRLFARRRRGRLHAAPRPGRSPAGAFAIGLLHGMGGSAGVGVLLLAAIPDHAEAAAALVVFAAATAASMASASWAFGYALTRAPALRPGRRRPAAGSGT